MLLVEYTLLDNLQVINENTTGGKTKLKLRGRFQKCDEQNNNGRIYPRKILESQVKKIQEKIGDRSLVGALDHPANDAIHLSQASHLITGLSVDKSGDVIGECEILSTPNGKIVESLINDGVKIGISSRGVGSVSEGAEGKIVNEDFKLITFDLVSDPSTKGAFPGICESMRENSQRAQAIVSKHKKDRVLMTMLESKVNEKLSESEAANTPSHFKTKSKLEKQVAHTKADRKALAALKLGDAAYKKKIQGHPGAARADQDANTAVSHVITTDSEERHSAHPKKKPKGKQGTLPFKNAQRSSTDIIGNSLMEGFKKVCWGDRYDEGEVKKRNKQKRRDFEAEQTQKTRAHHASQGRPHLMPTERMVKAFSKGGRKGSDVAAARQARQGIDAMNAETNAQVRQFGRMTQQQISNLHPREGDKRARLIRMGRIKPAKPKKK